MQKYINYLRYVLQHKYKVFIQCIKRGLYIHAFTHDFSKFRPSEFIPYARWYYGEKNEEVKVNNIRFVVEGIDKNRIKKVRIFT